LLSVAAIAAAASLVLAAVSFGWLVKSAHDAGSLSAIEREEYPTLSDSLDPSEYRFLRDRLRGARRYFLLPGPATLRSPLSVAGGRNFTLFFLYPALAVDDPQDAEVAIGIDGAQLDDLGLQTDRIERYRNVSIARLR
jgi:hypothetical protein